MYRSVCCHIRWSRWSLLFTTSCLTRGVKHCDIRSFQSTSSTITPIARPAYRLPCTIIVLAIAFLFPPLLLTIPSFLHAALVHQSLCVLLCCSLFVSSTHSSIHLSCNQFISILLHNSSVSSTCLPPQFKSANAQNASRREVLIVQGNREVFLGRRPSTSLTFFV